jgi:hypothetical protein
LIGLEHRFLVGGLPEMSESVPASLMAAGVPDDQFWPAASAGPTTAAPGGANQ